MPWLFGSAESFAENYCDQSTLHFRPAASSDAKQVSTFILDFNYVLIEPEPPPVYLKTRQIVVITPHHQSLVGSAKLVIVAPLLISLCCGAFQLHFCLTQTLFQPLCKRVGHGFGSFRLRHFIGHLLLQLYFILTKLCYLLPSLLLLSLRTSELRSGCLHLLFGLCCLLLHLDQLLLQVYFLLMKLCCLIPLLLLLGLRTSELRSGCVHLSTESFNVRQVPLQFKRFVA